MESSAIETQLDPVGVAKERAKLILSGWITAKEAAEMLNLTPRRVNDFLRSGRLSAMRVGRNWFIRRKDVLDFSGIKRKPGRPIPKESNSPSFKD